MIVPVDSAPPAHIVISAVDASRRSSSCSAVVINRGGEHRSQHSVGRTIELVAGRSLHRIVVCRQRTG